MNRTLQATLAIAALIAFSACGDDDDDDTPAPAATTGDTEMTTDTTEMMTDTTEMMDTTPMTSGG